MKNKFLGLAFLTVFASQVMASEIEALKKGFDIGLEVVEYQLQNEGYQPKIVQFAGQTSNQGEKKRDFSMSQSNNKCIAKLKDLVVTATNFENPFKKELSARISKDDDTNYTIELYVYDSGVNSENTVGWIRLDTKNNLLIDITSDPDEGSVLQYNLTLYNEYLSECLGLKTSIADEIKWKYKDEKPKICKLPFDFDEYYNTCYNSSNNDRCEQIYPKYVFNKESSISKIIKGKYSPVEYMYLPNIQSYQIVILCNTEADIEIYNVLVIDKDKITSSLEIGRISETDIMSFNISEEYLITLYKQKLGENKKIKWKSFKIYSDGIIRSTVD